jgi:hypothetical protein
MIVWNVATITPSGDHNTEVRVEFLSLHNASPEVTLYPCKAMPGTRFMNREQGRRTNYISYFETKSWGNLYMGPELRLSLFFSEMFARYPAIRIRVFKCGGRSLIPLPASHSRNDCLLHKLTVEIGTGKLLGDFGDISPPLTAFCYHSALMSG